MSHAQAAVGRHARSAALAAAVGSLASLSAAQPAGFQCAPLRPSEFQSPPYQRAPGQARCEGYFERNVSQPFIELISLTSAAPGAWAAAADGSIRLATRAKTAARLVVQPLRTRPLYRVDAALPTDAAFDWNAAPMLQSTGLRIRDLGFLAFAPSADDAAPAYLPVATPGAPPAADVAHAVLRPSVAVSSMAWRGWQPGADAPTAATPWRPLAGPPLYAWDRITLALPLPADGRPLEVDVRALDADGKPLPLLHFTVLGGP